MHYISLNIDWKHFYFNIYCFTCTYFLKKKYPRISGEQLLVRQSISISPLYHKRARIVFPMTFRTKTLHVGNLSFVVEDVLTDTAAGDVLITVNRQFFADDVSTGQSTELPVRLRYACDIHLANCKAFIFSVPVVCMTCFVN